jgi:predicted NUDIX family NTP pyrophosphohydrolase
MAPSPSAGILLYRGSGAGVEVFIAHMGGPFWARKDARAWSIPKGELLPGEQAVDAAQREFAEEVGVAVPDGKRTELGTFRYSSGKLLTVFAVEAPQFELAELVSNTFGVEWPPRSGRIRAFPELDDTRWVPLDDAREKLVAGQVPALDALLRQLGG